MSTTMSAVLLLFDIDGTLLLKASQAHVLAMHAALARGYGVTRAARAEAAGRTDLETGRHIALLAGVPATTFDEGIDDLREAVAVDYAVRVPDDLSGHVAPGVP